MEENKLAKIYLHVLLTTSLVHAGLDKLGEFKEQYRQRLKMTGNEFKKALVQVMTKDIPLVWGTDDEAMYLIMRYQEQAIEQMITMPPEDWGVLLTFLQQYKERPEETLTLLGLQKTDNSAEATKLPDTP